MLASMEWKCSEEETKFQEFFPKKKFFLPFLPKFSKIQSQWVVSAQTSAQQDHLAYLRQL